MTELDNPDDSGVVKAAGLLAVLDESPLARPTMRLAVTLAQRLGAGLTFHIAIDVEHLEALSPASVAQALTEHQEACEARARPLFDEALARARAAGVPASTVLTVDEAPLAAVQRLAQERHCLMIVVGSHGRGAVARALHGSLVSDLVRHAPLPVLVCRADMDLDAALALPASKPVAQPD